MAKPVKTPRKAATKKREMGSGGGAPSTAKREMGGTISAPHLSKGQRREAGGGNIAPALYRK